MDKNNNKYDLNMRLDKKKISDCVYARDAILLGASRGSVKSQQ